MPFTHSVYINHMPMHQTDCASPTRGRCLGLRSCTICHGSSYFSKIDLSASKSTFRASCPSRGPAATGVYSKYQSYPDKYKMIEQWKYRHAKRQALKQQPNVLITVTFRMLFSLNNKALSSPGFRRTILEPPRYVAKATTIGDASPNARQHSHTSF